MKNFRLTWIFALIGLLFTACDEEGENNVTPTELDNNEQEIVSQFLAADHAFSQTFIAMSQLGLNPETDANGVRSANCPSWIFEGEEGTLSLGFDYGENCEDQLGNIFSGKILATFEGEEGRFGAMSLIFDNFIYNDTLLNGTLQGTIEVDDDGTSFLTGKLIDGLFKIDDQNSISMSYERRFDWKVGSNTPRNTSDDIFEITGIGEYVSTLEGAEFAFTFESNSPITYKTACAQQGSPYFSDGGLTINYSELGSTSIDQSFSVDYGDGSCDADIVLTINGTSFNTSLQYFWFL